METENLTLTALREVLEHFKKERNQVGRALRKLEEKGDTNSTHYWFVKGVYDTYKWECIVLSKEITIRRELGLI